MPSKKRLRRRFRGHRYAIQIKYVGKKPKGTRSLVVGPAETYGLKIGTGYFTFLNGGTFTYAVVTVKRLQ